MYQGDTPEARKAAQASTLLDVGVPGGAPGVPAAPGRAPGALRRVLRESFQVQNGPERGRSRSGLRLQRDAPSPKRRAFSGRSIFRVRSRRFGPTTFRFARRTMNLGSKTIRFPAWRPFFLRSQFLSWGVGACGRRPLQSADPRSRRAGRFSCGSE